MPPVPTQCPKPTCATAAAAPRQPVPPSAEWFAPVATPSGLAVPPSPGQVGNQDPSVRVPPARQMPIDPVGTPGESRTMSRDALQFVAACTPISVGVPNAVALTPNAQDALSHTPVRKSARRRSSSVPEDAEKDAPVMPQNIIPEGIDPRSFRQWAFGVAKALRSLESSVDTLRKRLDAVEGTHGPSHPKTKAFKYNTRADGSEKTWTPTIDLSCTRLMVDRAASDPEPRVFREPPSASSNAMSKTWNGTDSATMRRQWRLELEGLTPREGDASPQRNKLPQRKDPAVSVPKIQALVKGSVQTDIKTQIVQTPLSKEARFRSTTLRTPRTGGPTTPRGQKGQTERQDIWCEVAERRPLSPTRRSITPDKTPRTSPRDSPDEEALDPEILFETVSEASQENLGPQSPHAENREEEVRAQASPPVMSPRPEEAAEESQVKASQENPAQISDQLESVVEETPIEVETNAASLTSSLHETISPEETREELEITAAVVTPEIPDINTVDLEPSSDEDCAPTCSSLGQSEAIADANADSGEVFKESTQGENIKTSFGEQQALEERAAIWECSPCDGLSPLQPTTMPGVIHPDIRPLDSQSEEAQKSLESDLIDAQSPSNTVQ